MIAAIQAITEHIKTHVLRRKVGTLSRASETKR